MRGFSLGLGCWLALVFVFLGLGSLSALETFTNARLVDFDSADGDSFMVEFERDGQTTRQVLRLYYADCCETEAATDSDRRRVLEQMRYFGLETPTQVFEAGHQAADFVKETLAQPFTVHTAFASALGRSRLPRIYGMITTSDGQDLAELLIAKGLARARGVRRAMPDGTPSSERTQYLADVEAGAMLSNQGIWAQSTPEKLAELRAKERREQRDLHEAFGTGSMDGEVNLIDINTANQSTLERLPGIGPALAKRIIEARPFVSLEELTGIPGISTTTLDGLVEFATVSTESNKASEQQSAKISAE